MYVCVPGVCFVALEARRGPGTGVTVQMVVSYHVMLGIKPGSLGRASRALNHGAVYPAPHPKTLFSHNRQAQRRRKTTVQILDLSLCCIRSGKVLSLELIFLIRKTMTPPSVSRNSFQLKILSSWQRRSPG